MKIFVQTSPYVGLRVLKLNFVPIVLVNLILQDSLLFKWTCRAEHLESTCLSMAPSVQLLIYNFHLFSVGNQRLCKPLCLFTDLFIRFSFPPFLRLYVCPTLCMEPEFLLRGSKIQFLFCFFFFLFCSSALLMFNFLFPSFLVINP